MIQLNAWLTWAERRLASVVSFVTGGWLSAFGGHRQVGG